MEKLKDDIEVTRDGEKFVVTRTIQEKYEVEEMEDLVKRMEEQLERLSKQIEALKKEQESIKESLEFWKTKLAQ